MRECPLPNLLPLLRLLPRRSPHDAGALLEGLLFQRSDSDLHLCQRPRKHDQTPVGLPRPLLRLSLVGRLHLQRFQEGPHALFEEPCFQHGKSALNPRQPLRQALRQGSNLLHRG